MTVKLVRMCHAPNIINVNQSIN